MKESSIVILSYHSVRVPFPSAHSLYTVQTSLDLSRIGEVYFYANRGDDRADFRTLYGADLTDVASFHLRITKLKHKGVAGIEKRIAVLKDICRVGDRKKIVYVTQARPLHFFLFLKKMGVKIRILVEPHSETEAWSKSDFEAVDGIIFTSGTLQRRLTERYIISPELPQTVFYHRVRSSLSDKLSIHKTTAGNYCIGYLGGLEEWKGVNTIIEALRYLPENVTAHFIGGETRGQSRLLSRANELGIEKRVRFTRRVQQEELIKESQDIDAFILPLLQSEHGSLPMKLFDYMYLGKPIIAANQESIKEILSDRTALFFPAGSDSDLAEQIKTLMNNPSLGIDLSENAYNALKSYTADNWLAGMEQFLRNL